MDPEQEPAAPPAIIVWHDWNDKAFQLAQQQDKPILLCITTTWCHWCKAMDETTFADPQIAAQIQSEFVPIRVDHDRRPEIASRYHMGGWPTTAFLTPNGDVLYGGTYLSPLAMRLLLMEISQTYRQKRAEIYSRLEEMKSEESQPGPYPVDRLQNARGQRLIVNDVVKNLIDGFDHIFGGFGIQPKFPQPEALAFLQRHVHLTGDPVAGEMVQKMLDAIRSGPIYDREEGGFFHYATRRDWSAPQFEKLLEVNAGLLANYLWAFQRTQNPACQETARGVLEYVDARLTDPERGGFFASQAADEEYYHHRLVQRELLPEPPVDKTIYTDWNARMASVYLLAAATLDVPGALEQALKTLDRLWRENYVPGRGMVHAVSPTGNSLLWLSDQVWMLSALADAHLHTAQERYLQQAEELLEVLVGALWNSEEGGFFDVVPNANAWGALSKPQMSVKENAMATEVLFYLGRVRGRGEYRERGIAALQAILPNHNQNAFHAASFAAAVYGLLFEPASFTVIGPAESPETRAFVTACLNVFEPGKTVQRWDPQANGGRIAATGYPYQGTPLAIVRLGDTDAPPVLDPQDLNQTLQALRNNLAE